MSQNRTKMNSKLPPECPHICSKQVATINEIKKLGKNVNVCASCDCSGPNLWICLQRSCLRTGCSEQANDHSTQHFQHKSTHCVHMNLSSQRVWCYLCEREVFLNIKHSSCNTGSEAKTGNYQHYSHHDTIEDDDSVAEEEEEEDDKAYGGLLGLQNIANTCYMNSALQALSNVQPMTHYFLNCSELVEHSVEQSAQRSKAGLAKSYQRLMREIWCQSRGSSSVAGAGDEKDYIAPRGILYGIRSVHPMFRGFQQHDTQEFLRCFMDQLHEELKEQSPICSPLLSTTNGGAGKRIGTATDNHKHKQRQEQDKWDKVDEEENEEDDDSATSSSSTSCHSSSHSDTEYETCDSSVSDSHSTSNDAPPFVTTFNGGGGGVERSLRNSNSDAAIELPSSQPAARSIISDIFDGKLLSSVQCLTCDRLSTREETFQDLSLPIPNRDYLNMLHRTHSLSAQSLNSIDSIGSRGGGSSVSIATSDNWLSWMWSLVRSWLWGPSVTLHDCMASFFSADELKGDNMYSCEKCNKLRTGVKYSQILDLPEVLCIHLKRFRHDLSYSTKISSYVMFPLEGLNMRPYLHKNCKSRIVTYNLVSVICHHGTVGGGHYTCYARNAYSKRWYEFDDQQVTEVTPETVQNCQAYVLFYRKHNPQMELVRTEAGDLNAAHPVYHHHGPTDADGIRFFIAREWLSRFKTFAEPGPINNWAMLCQHGGLMQSKIALLRQIAVPISQPLWDFLYRTFGGGPAINMLFECEVCKRAADALSRRQYYELAVFTKYAATSADMDADMDASSAIFAISMPWLRKWQQFARGLTPKEPGPIVNANIEATTTMATAGEESLSQSLQSPIRNVRLGSDYAQLNAPLWRFLHDIYGGGPEIILRGSLTEEIEIIDQDEYDGDSNRRNPDLSDTESNIGQQNMSEFNEVQLPQSQEHPKINLEDKKDQVEPMPTSPPPTKITKTTTIIQRENNSKHNRHTAAAESKKIRASALRSSLRKKTMKNRNAMKNSDFFGPKDYIAPRGILYGIRSVHPMFRGFQQHDTQEVLRCFMDQLHEELKEQSPICSPLLSTTNGGAGKRIGTATDNHKHKQRQEQDKWEQVDEEENEEDDDSATSSSSTSCHFSSHSDTEYETCDSSVSDSHSTSNDAPPFVTTFNGGGGGVGRSLRTSNSDAAIELPSSQPAARSIISDIFDGKLLSSVQCLTCDRLSTREDTFQDLSLPIPNRDYLNMLHRTHSLSAQSLNSIDSIGSRGGGSSVSIATSGNWLSWMWSLVRSWLWGPSVTLHDCMASFFSADELKGDNMYSCEKCNKLRTGVKYSQILDLPEVLCIHLKRFRHDLSYSTKISSYVMFPLEGLNMRPYLHKNCKSRIVTYNLVSVICHHGTVGGGHYTCYARNAYSKRWYEFDDQQVTEVTPETVQNCQAYVLFYRKHNPQMELVRTEAGDLNAAHPVYHHHGPTDADGIRFFIAREWLSRFKTFAEPGPINNWAMLCQHGGLMQSKIALLRQIAVPISQPLWDFLYRTFGGEPAINMLFECEVCKRAADALSRRQYYELAVFTKYAATSADMDADMDASSAIFAISMPWLRKWQQFARGLTPKEPGFKIEIIDQDEYDGDSNRRNPDLSDTESNIGQQNMSEFNEVQLPQSQEHPKMNLEDKKDQVEPMPTSPPPTKITKTTTIIQRENNSKHNRHTAAAESKTRKRINFGCAEA